MQARILRSAVLIFSSFAFVVPQLAAAPLEAVVQDSVIKPPVLRGGSEVFTFVEHAPSFPGGKDSLNKYLATHIRYSSTAAQENITGTVFVNFIVTMDGELTRVRTVGAPLGSGLEDEAIRVVEAMPKWNPGKQNGRLVNVQFSLPIRFPPQDNISDNVTNVVMVDRLPDYPGGISAMMKYLHENIQYPKEAKEKGLRGIVYVEFDIDTDGSISNVRTIVKKIGGGLEEEAIRVVSGMPNWKPAKYKRKPVRVKHVLPVHFLLET